MPNLFDLTGKVALVTGAARGLGDAIARALVEHGAATVLCDLDEEALHTAAQGIAAATGGDGPRALRCDVRDRQAVQAVADAVHAAYGRIDVLVNNAGIHRRATPLAFSQEDADDLFATNLLGAFYMAGAVGRVMIAQGSGSIINLSALGGGVVGLGRGGSLYGMTKGGVVALTRDLAAEWGKHGVRVNALAPGWIRTPMTEALQHDERRAARVLQRVPLGRWGTAEDVAGVAVFLASDASRYVTGHTIPVDGGAANVIALSED